MSSAPNGSPSGPAPVSTQKISHIVCAERYALASVADTEGYRVVHDADGKRLHYLNPANASDGRAVDPARIESLLYVVLPGGSKLLVGGMFTMPKVQRDPAVGGSLTQWHAHDDLCLDPVKAIAITQLPGRGCPAGSAVGATCEMTHDPDSDDPDSDGPDSDGVSAETSQPVCALHLRRRVQPVGDAAGLSAAAPSVQAWSRSRP